MERKHSTSKNSSCMKEEIKRGWKRDREREKNLPYNRKQTAVLFGGYSNRGCNMIRIRKYKEKSAASKTPHFRTKLCLV